MKRSLLSLSAVACALVGMAYQGRALAQTGPTDPYGGMEGRLFDAGGGFTMPYRLGKPPAYNAATKYPLVIFLHGSGESGTDNRLNISKNIGTNGPGSVFTTAANQAKFPTFFIAPQSPNANIGWMSGSKPLVAVLKLITALEAEFSIDPKRLYVTGLSLGGMGTWTIITENPDLFAAAIPMSGSGDPSMAAKIVKVPIWDFHGAIDPAVNVSGSRLMIAALRAAGANPRYTEYPNGMHDIWFMAYNTPDLLPWMNTQRLGVADPTGDGGVPIVAPPDAGASDASTGAGGGGAGSGGAGASGTGGAGTGAAGTTGSAGATGAGGTGTGAAGTTGAAGSGTGAAGTTGSAGTTGAAGTKGAGGTTGTAGSSGSSGGCACGIGGAGSAMSLSMSAGVALALGALIVSARRRGRRRRSRR
jgi:acetyl esterase/lipase